MVEEKDYTKLIVKERITKSFSTDIQTLGMIKDFMEKYHCNNFSRAIDDLVNIGLANLGYRTEKEIETRLKGSGLILERITVPESKSLDIDIIATGISHSERERMKLILDVIQRLSVESEDNSVNREDIISEAEIQGIEERKVNEALDRLLQDGQICKTPYGKYALMTYP